ncbi:hypothetical protein DFP72DRAFT_821895, partial [Ephemerocybe angulata]
PSQLNAWSSSSCSQLEKDRQAQSAKLQELIRRGTPRNLAAAQEPVMKSLAGANPEAKPDYCAQSLTELNKLEQKVILLNEMLDNVDTSRGEKFTTGEAYDQVSSILKAARPKMQKWISDAQNDDPESLDTFLQINDQINSVVNRYEAFKKGDYSIAGTIPAELAPSAQPTSLIDFDDSETAPAAANANPANDLAGLFGGASSSSSPPAPQQPSVVSPLQLHSELRAVHPLSAHSVHSHLPLSRSLRDTTTDHLETCLALPALRSRPRRRLRPYVVVVVGVSPLLVGAGTRGS